MRQSPQGLRTTDFMIPAWWYDKWVQWKLENDNLWEIHEASGGLRVFRQAYVDENKILVPKRDDFWAET